MVNVDRAWKHRDIEQLNTSENTTTKISAFNEDFDYAIFDISDLAQLIQYAKNPQVSDYVTKHIFPVKYNNYDFNIRTDELNAEQHVDEFQHSLYVSGYNLFMDLIKYFGVSIHKLNIRNTERTNDDHSAAIHKQVNEYCSKSLNYLFLGIIKDIVLKQFEKPFTALKELTFQLMGHQTGSFESMDKMFPNLKKLTITYFDSTEENQLNRFIESDVPHMENLQELVISFELTNRSDIMIVQEQHRKLFEKNSQIRILSYTHDLDDFVQVINNNLPNLEKFSVYQIDFDIQPIRFDRIKHFTVSSSEPSPVEKLSFPRLESIDMIYDEKHTNNKSARDSWLTFFKHHQNIRLLDFRIDEFDGFVEFLSELPNVDEIRIETSHNFNINIVRELIEGHTNLMKLKYKSFSNGFADGSNLAIYNEKIANQWHINYNDQGWPILTFEKIN